MSDFIEALELVVVPQKPKALIFLVRSDAEIGMRADVERELREALDRAGLEGVGFCVLQGLDVVGVDSPDYGPLAARALDG